MFTVKPWGSGSYQNIVVTELRKRDFDNAVLLRLGVSTLEKRCC